MASGTPTMALLTSYLTFYTPNLALPNAILHAVNVIFDVHDVNFDVEDIVIGVQASKMGVFLEPITKKKAMLEIASPF